MAVVPGADEIDRALDRAAQALTREAHVPADRALAAASLVGEWRAILRHALDRHDIELAVLAAKEWGHWRAVLEQITGENVPP
jgi:hypothetical protein